MAFLELGLSSILPCSFLWAVSSCLSWRISLLFSFCSFFFLDFVVVCGVDRPIILMVSSRCARLSVASLVTRVQKDSRASLVVGFQPLSEGCVLGLLWFPGDSSVLKVLESVHVTCQWSDLARLGSFGFCMCAWPGVPSGMNM